MNLFFKLLELWDDAVDSRLDNRFYRALRRCSGQERVRQTTQRQLRMRKTTQWKRRIPLVY